MAEIKNSERGRSFFRVRFYHDRIYNRRFLRFPVFDSKGPVKYFIRPFYIHRSFCLPEIILYYCNSYFYLKQWGKENSKWRGTELNRRRRDFQSLALPTELPRLDVKKTITKSSESINLSPYFVNRFISKKVIN